MEATQDLLSTTINSLFVQAARDGIITQYERDIIQQVEFDIKRYCLALEMAISDDIIDEMELEFLDKIAKDIFLNAEKKAISDGILNRNEKDLLRKLDKILKIYFTI